MAFFAGLVKGITTLPQGIIRVQGYTVDLIKTLGKGSFGTVHPAVNHLNLKTAAKRVDGNDKTKMLKITKDLARLHELNHRNIVKVLDVFQRETVIWVMMEFCNKGDLNSYFQTSRIPDTEMLSIMIDIANGVEYLHSKNVIHRDIKPDNILITRGLQNSAKLTDFDLSRFLEEDYDTSVLTTDVGTRAFKAPEFWKRTADGKLNYHRNVDIYAMGLTFLAMIQGKKKLCPVIETPTEDSELHQPIGALIAERVKFKIEPLEIISDQKSLSHSQWVRDIRGLIQKMTRVVPQERLLARAVVEELAKIKVSVSSWEKIMDVWG